MSGTSLNSAVNAVVSSFQTHSNQTEVDAIEALKEFWQLKKTKDNLYSDSGEINYEILHSGPPYICYVTLPGGSCFGSYEECSTIDEAKQSAAKIALTNSVMNEHTSNVISPFMITQMLSAARKSFSPNKPNCNTEPIDVFKSLLHDYIGKSFLSFQEKMSVFQLLHYCGNIKAMKDSGCAREEILEHFMCRGIDDDLISKMALDWVMKEKIEPGIIAKELNQGDVEIASAQKAGRELRFYKEKLNILQQALDLVDSESNQ